MLLYQADIEILLKVTSTLQVLTWLKNLPLIGRYLSNEESEQYLQRYLFIREKLLAAKASCTFVTIDEADVPILVHIITSALGGTGTVDRAFANKSPATVVLAKILRRLETEFPEYFESGEES